MKRLAIVPFFVLGVAGCVSESANLGAPPPVLLSSPARIIFVPPKTLQSASGRAHLKAELSADVGGDLHALRAQIRPRTPGEAEPLRRMLVGLGLESARISVESRPQRDHRPTELSLSRTLAATAPCATAIHPAFPDDPLPSLMSLARCTQDNNLAAMMADPADLVAPPVLDPEDGAYLAGGIHDWRANRGQALPAVGTSSSSGGASAGGGSPSAATSAAAPVAEATPANTIQPGQATVTP